MKTYYIYEKLVGLVECNLSRNSHIVYDVRPSDSSAIAYVALGRKSLETLGL